MENKWTELLNKWRSGDKRIRLFVLLGLVCILLILLSEMLPHAQSAKKQQAKEENLYASYIASLEEKTADLIGSIQGAGRCKVMITLKDTPESVFARNQQENESDSSYSKNYEYVLYDGQDGETPVLIKQYYPAVQGVAVVCDGADSTVVRESIINSIASLYNISVSKISVSKYKG